MVGRNDFSELLPTSDEEIPPTSARASSKEDMISSCASTPEIQRTSAATRSGSRSIGTARHWLSRRRSASACDWGRSAVVEPGSYQGKMIRRTGRLRPRSDGSERGGGG